MIETRAGLGGLAAAWPATPPRDEAGALASLAAEIEA